MKNKSLNDFAFAAINEFYSLESTSIFADSIAKTYRASASANVIQFADNATMLDAAKTISTHVNRKFEVNNDNLTITISLQESNNS